MNSIKYSQQEYIERRRRKKRHAAYRDVAIIAIGAFIAVKVGLFIGGIIAAGFL